MRRQALIPCTRPMAARPGAVAACLVLAASLAVPCGCAPKWLSVRSVPDSPLVERLQLTGWRGPQPSSRTVQVLRRFGLPERLDDASSLVVLDRLHERLIVEPRPDTLHALAEVAYLAGKRAERHDRRAALDLHAIAASNAYLYLFDPRFAPSLNPYDPQFREVCDLYNGALEETLRLAQAEGMLQPGRTHTLQTASETCRIDVVSRGQGWHVADCARFEFANDFAIRGLRNQYRHYGLGVPLVAVRNAEPAGAPLARYYAPRLAFPVTAFLRVLPDEPAAAGPAPAVHHAALELYDPLSTGETTVEGRRVPLESDLTTPLAYFLHQGSLPPLATLGLLRPDEATRLRGLYMAQPYEPDKVPVVFVHGLWSDPTTWAEMFNDLRGSPEIRANYQFWFYFYPSGQPFWVSAGQFRRDLAELRRALDPDRRQDALDQMVLVGHSMGGLVSKLQVLDSGDTFWQTASTRPFRQVKMTADVRDAVAGTFYFRANPSVRRVITIGTPHRGSSFANATTRYLGARLIALPKRWLEGQQALFRENPAAFPDGSALRVTTSIDSLAQDSPFLPAMLAARRPPWVRLHNIVGVTELDETGALPEDAGDGVVSYASAHLDDADSEVRVAADHLGVHRHPLSVLEVRRILLAHLAEVRADRGAPSWRVYPAAQP